ncbi:MAG: glycosyltransferase family 39 protein [bacterium]
MKAAKSWRIALPAFVALFLAQVGADLARTAGTCDELAAHLPAGILAWKSGTFSGGLANPPIGQRLVAAGAIVAGTADHPLATSPRDLWPARLPVVLLGLATLLGSAEAGRRIAGPVAGVAAGGAAALSPNLVAHSQLATLDVPVTTFSLLAALAAWSWVRTQRNGALLAWAITVGTACLVKFTAFHLLLAVPVGALLVPGARLRRAAALFGAGVLGVTVLAWIAYGFHDGAFFLWPRGLYEGLAEKWSHGRAGHLAYLLGARSENGFPHYFLVAVAVKTPPALLLAAIVGVVASARSAVDGDRRGFVAFLVLPALWIFAAMSLVHRVDIGLRHVLPVYPALFALAGVGWASLAGRGRAARAAALVLLVAAGYSAATATPHHLSYFARWTGGPARADRLLIDSNLDWGQDEDAFRAWARGRNLTVNPIRPVAGVVAANVNAIRGALSRDDLRLRWVRHLSVERAFGATWRVFRVDEAVLRRAAERDPVAALDYAWWLVGVGRSEEAAAVLRANDLSSHERYGAEWWRVRGEAALASGDLPLAIDAARRGADPDLLAVAIHRREVANGNDAPPEPREGWTVVAALSRRGEREEAERLGRRWFDRDVFAPTGRLDVEEVRRLRSLGLEREALAVAGQALAVDPASEDLLWAYGELVVRRRLGLTEYEWPQVDWTNVARVR